MYEIHQREIPEAFLDAWTAAGRHLNAISQGSVGWLRCDLHQPLAEHLSFRLGNQLFFVFVEVPGLMEFTLEDRRLLLLVSDEADGVPCLLRMRQIDGRYVPEGHLWGMTHARTGKPVIPPALVTSDLIEMTDWEVHDFALQVVRGHLDQQGWKLLNSQPSPHINPSIGFMRGHERGWIVVRAVRYPLMEAPRPATLHETVAFMTERLNAAGYFASVAVANADQEDGGVVLPLYRGHALLPCFDGLERIETGDQA